MAKKKPIIYSFGAMLSILFALSWASGGGQVFKTAPTAPAGKSFKPAPVGKAISPDLFGIFFEDINYAADGGLYAELVQNRSFEYQATEQKSWNPLSFWDVKTYGDGRGSLEIDAGRPVHVNNQHYAVLDVARVG